MFDFFVTIDRSLFLFFNASLSNPIFDGFFTYITQQKNALIPLLLLIPFLFYKEKKRAFIILGLAGITIAITDPLCYRMLKPWFHRLRPCHPSYFIDAQHIFLPGANFLFGHKTSYSFPSSHAMNIAGQAMLFSRIYPRLTAVFFSFAALVALSRVYVGVHYPSDVIVGAFIGMGIGFFVYSGYLWGERKLKAKKEIEQSVQK